MAPTRRSCLSAAVAALIPPGSFASPVAPESKSVTALTNRAHILAPLSVKQQLVNCFATVLGCGQPTSLTAPGHTEPILAFGFPGGGSLSVEFTDEALDDQHARRGAWLELKSDDPASLIRRVRDAGLPQVHYWAATSFYFAAPGGQVFGISPAQEKR